MCLSGNCSSCSHERAAERDRNNVRFTPEDLSYVEILRHSGLNDGREMWYFIRKCVFDHYQDKNGLKSSGLQLMAMSDFVVEPSQTMFQVLPDGQRKRLVRFVKNRMGGGTTGNLVTEGHLRALIADQTAQNISLDSLFSSAIAYECGC